ncbi:MAG: hypothetical protein VKJ64_18590 [Leptolyngbyaceae bacterium]|nr:hypothetical protein [Leptolyngbyaceae bacterium]
MSTLFLLRFAERQFLGLLFHEPPRSSSGACPVVSLAHLYLLETTDHNGIGKQQ